MYMEIVYLISEQNKFIRRLHGTGADISMKGYLEYKIEYAIQCR